MKLQPHRRAAPISGLILVIAGLGIAVSPAIPAVSALDPTPMAAAAASVDPLASVDALASASIDPLASPSVDPLASPSVDPLASPSADPLASPSADPLASPSALPGELRVTHYWIDMETPDGAIASAGALDDPRIDLTRFVVYRVRFQVLNTGVGVQAAPVLLAGAGAQPTAWAPLPAAGAVEGQPFYAAADNGGVDLVRSHAIPVADLRAQTSSDPTAVPVPGLFSAGLNPAPTVDLPAGSFTEVEFAVRATVEAAWQTAYAFRLSLDGATVAGQVDAPVSLGAAPLVVLSPGQQTGEVVDAPVPLYQLLMPGQLPGALGAYGLATPRTAVSYGLITPNPPVYTSPHQMYTLADDTCAACHAAHTAAGRFLLQTSLSPVSNLCFRCHDTAKTGSSKDVQSQFSGATPSDPSTSSYYSHPATSVSTHNGIEYDLFAGVSNRHAECTDCHQPHDATAALGTQSTTGWTAPGAIQGITGVAVTNGAANAAPTYTELTRVTYEYQLCFKCHSGYTTLRAQQAGFPSRWALDKGTELNPANLSYHPIEAAGANQNAKMDGSLAGTSPYKLWTFTKTSTIRCANCHGPSSAAAPAVDAQLDTHASGDRGILLRNYRDRVLKSRGQNYAASDFALCYLCHSEAPFLDTSGDIRTDTNFNLHGFHVAGLIAKGSLTAGTSIDVAGNGAGNAVCAECHFRIHGSSFTVNGQTPQPALVDFAPSVQPHSGASPIYVRTSYGHGSCALLCHGQDHEPKFYPG